MLPNVLTLIWWLSSLSHVPTYLMGGTRDAKSDHNKPNLTRAQRYKEIA